jgi:splicing factor U2AF 65 kDa subunit
LACLIFSFAFSFFSFFAVLQSSGGAPSQQTRHARRLYVGGLGDALEREVEEYFSRIIKASVTDPTSAASRLPNPVLSVYLNPERKFAFVEFCSIELANALVELGDQGLQFRGNLMLKLRRPDDYKPEVLPPEIRHKKEPLDYTKLPLSAPRMVYSTVQTVGAGGAAASVLMAAPAPGSGSNAQLMPVAANGVMLWKLYLGNLPPQMTEAQLFELVSAFGVVKKLEVPKQSDTGLPRGYAFLEYQEQSQELVDRAIAGLDGLQVGDKRLSASRAKASTAAAASTLGVPINAVAAAGFGGPTAAPSSSSSGAASMLPFAPSSGSKVALLENMVSIEEDLATEQARGAFIAEVVAECVKYGPLHDIVVPPRGAPGEGRCFLEYKTPEGAQAALFALNGRQFGGRTIVGRQYDEAAYYGQKNYTL